MAALDDPKTLGRTRLSFADAAEIDDFVTTLERFESGATIDESVLRQAGLVKGAAAAGVKVLGDGKLSKKLTVHASKFSESARKQIEAAGGTCQETE